MRLLRRWFSGLAEFLQDVRQMRAAFSAHRSYALAVRLRGEGHTHDALLAGMRALSAIPEAADQRMFTLYAILIPAAVLVAEVSRDLNQPMPRRDLEKALELCKLAPELEFSQQYGPVLRQHLERL